jgi:hypothetical protein
MLDVVIGLVFLYFVLSIICTAGNELVASLINLRGIKLRAAIIRLLTVKVQDGKDKGKLKVDYAKPELLANKVLGHPLLATLYTRSWWTPKFPSYIPPKTFALALHECLKAQTGSPENTAQETRASKMRDDPLKHLGIVQIYEAFKEQAGDSTKKLQERLETVFDEAMDRVSGSYKRWSQLVIFLIALIVVVASNADTVQIVRTLSTDSAAREALVAQAQARVQQQGQEPAQPAKGNKKTPTVPAEKSEASKGQARPQNSGAVFTNPPSAVISTPTLSAGAADEPADDPAEKRYEELAKSVKKLQDLQTLGVPLGWKDKPWNEVRKPFWWDGFQDTISKLIGLLLTVLAVSLGAPFWFDLLNKIVNIRGTGTALQTATGEEQKK